MATQSYTTAGTTAWVCPAYVSVVKVELWGGGGNGGYGGGPDTEGGAGGGGGAYAQGTAVTVTPGASYNVVVGGVAGNSTFNATTVVADAGNSASGQTNGDGGLVAASTGDIKYAGGSGTNTIVNSISISGGGAAGPDGAGNNGAWSAAGGSGDAGSGGAGGAWTGANGGVGGSNVKGGGGGGAAGNNSYGGAGGAPGAGGGGGEYGYGAGAVGQAILTYFENPDLIPRNPDFLFNLL